MWSSPNDSGTLVPIDHGIWLEHIEVVEENRLACDFVFTHPGLRVDNRQRASSIPCTLEVFFYALSQHFASVMSPEHVLPAFCHKKINRPGEQRWCIAIVVTSMVFDFSLLKLPLQMVPKTAPHTSKVHKWRLTTPRLIRSLTIEKLNAWGRVFERHL
jgi:hypothetical protein